MEVREPNAKYLRTSYVQTELGMLPADWRIAEIGEIAETSSGTTPSRSQYDRYFKGGIHAWVKTLDLNNAEILETDESVTDKAVEETSLRLFPEGSVLVAMYGGLRQIGRTGLLRLPAAVNQAITAIRPNQAVFRSEFLLFYLNHRVGHWQSVASSSRKDPNITGADVRAFKLPLPEIGEQQRVATALADANALSESLEQLLTKKRQIKQGVMQELLTGKRRLPGFLQPWSEVRLGDVGRTYGGLTGKAKADFGHGASKYITFMNVMTTVRTSTEMVESVEVGPSESQNMVQPGDLLFNGSSETPEEVAFCSWVESCHSGVFLNSFCFGFRPFSADRLSGLFMAYFFRGRPGRAAVSSLAQGATRYNIAKTALLQAPLYLPTFAEQQAIAEVLSSMDTEIDALESRLTKARTLKQAMAQALLTGRVRLVELTA